MKGRKPSSALFYSLAEFSWILLFLSIGAAALLFAEYRQASERIVFMKAEIEELTREVDFLNQQLAEKKYGVVPCWRRPEGLVPEIVGTLSIHTYFNQSVTRTADGKTIELQLRSGHRREQIADALKKLFAHEIEYAGCRNCYLRMRIINATNSFALYTEAADAAEAAGIVVVHE